MLILLLRTWFVVLATLLGLKGGSYWYTGMPLWFGAAMGFGIAVTLIAVEQAFRRGFARSLVGVVLGGAGGMALSGLEFHLLHLALADEEKYSEMVVPLALPMALVTIYLVIILVLRNLDRWRVVIPFVEFRSEITGDAALVLDAAMLGDSRLPGLVRTGLFAQRLLIHRDLLDEVEAQARSAEPTVQVRAARALDGLKELRGLAGTRVEIVETEVPNVHDLHDLLVRLARLESARLAAGDRDLLRRAEAEGVAVVDLAGLAQLLTPMGRPGEIIAVAIEKSGEGRNQGVGFLPDGSMVVVTGAQDAIGRTIQITIMRVHTTGNGRMVFGEMLKEKPAETKPAGPPGPVPAPGAGPAPVPAGAGGAGASAVAAGRPGTPAP
jgi:uncharacterized protein YacL